MKNIRLNKIADMVKKGVTAADIGTDHALLPILLIDNQICPKVYACDVAKGPLLAAQTNIAKVGLSEHIPTVLSDGLKNVPSDADACILAGMGCITAVEIFEASFERLIQMKQIIVVVNRDTTKMREWISDHHFTIEEEIYISDRDHDYIALSFTPQEHAPYSKEELLLGPILQKKKDPAYFAYCQRQKEKIDAILAQAKENAFHLAQIQEDRSIYEAYLNQ